MKYLTIKNHNISRFSLGTVQLGMDYGIGDDKAKPSAEKAFSILDRAMEHGINNLDTANNYGDSEQTILLRQTFTKIDPRVINPGVWYNHT